jgi:inorganic triphosphatase YgiF
VPLERERKFSSPEGHVPSRAELALALEPTEFSIDAGRVVRQRDTYFDDARGSLRAAGWALRLRRVGGRTVATAKSAGRVEGTLHEREEVEAEVPDDDAGEDVGGARPGGIAGPAGVRRVAGPAASRARTAPTWPAAIVRTLPTWLDPATFAPVVLLDTARIAFTLRSDAGAVVELAFDEVRCRLPADTAAPAGTASAFSPEALFHEVEIEAKAGAADHDLTVIDDTLEAILTLTPSSVNKLERALALLAPFRPEPRGTGD